MSKLPLSVLRKVAVTSAAVAAAGAAAVAIAPSASADRNSAAAECSTSYYCVWIAAYDTGNKASFKYDNPNWSTTAYYWMVHNDSSSYNDTAGNNAVLLMTEYGPYCSRPFAYWSLHNPNDAGIGNDWVTAC
ncbi:peptidase inhibitor family I36 protein [Actinomadura alba]|uniref:Peptidase inhibitor family I36 protein n=1 Tax=Actinomadura alba TaxID=406431 RepID=A0ABR7LVD5_9ACTN|nr:peptidase inhibitor family I36 protein [Actinomadura alba]MBC6468814.1 peptidase inhibitor family I36 protein [Actinomadura alba]